MPIQELIPRRGPSPIVLAASIGGARPRRRDRPRSPSSGTARSTGTEATSRRSAVEYRVEGTAFEKRLYVGDSLLVSLQQREVQAPRLAHRRRGHARDAGGRLAPHARRGRHDRPRPQQPAGDQGPRQRPLQEGPCEGRGPARRLQLPRRGPARPPPRRRSDPCRQLGRPGRHSARASRRRPPPPACAAAPAAAGRALGPSGQAASSSSSRARRPTPSSSR